MRGREREEVRYPPPRCERPRADCGPGAPLLRWASPSCARWRRERRGRGSSGGYPGEVRHVLEASAIICRRVFCFGLPRRAVVLGEEFLSICRKVYRAVVTGELRRVWAVAFSHRIPVSGWIVRLARLRAVVQLVSLSASLRPRSIEVDMSQRCDASVQHGTVRQVGRENPRNPFTGRSRVTGRDGGVKTDASFLPSPRISPCTVVSSSFW
jgi:hypothetical protein